jgi:tetratricopeptide (TPR) repeat protein
MRPDFFGALMNHGRALRELGRPKEAAESFRKAVAHSPGTADAQFQLGAVLLDLNKAKEAAAALQRAVQLRPDHADTQNLLGVAWRRLLKKEDAVACLRRALELRPDFAEALTNLGNALLDLQDFTGAVDCHRQALALKPEFAEALCNLGIALAWVGQPEEGAETLKRALALQPGRAGTLNAIARLLLDANRVAESLEYYEKAMAADPSDRKIVLDWSLALLLATDFARGWEAYEARWETDLFLNSGSPYYECPHWEGEPIAGKRLLVLAEQGLGDTIQFIRYIPLLAAAGARIILQVQDPLKPLIPDFPGAEIVIDRSSPPAEFNLLCSLLSLPYLLRDKVEAIPEEVPYLKVPADREAAWHDRLAGIERPRVGLVWAGNASFGNDKRRSIPLAELRPLLSLPDIRFVTLQKELRAGDAELLAEFPGILRLGESLTDFADTAGLIANLDLVISVDTAVAHLAGALARPVWLMIPFAPDWRWQLDREDSPWYPTARLFRQSVRDDWTGVVGRIADALLDLS